LLEVFGIFCLRDKGTDAFLGDLFRPAILKHNFRATLSAVLTTVTTVVTGTTPTGSKGFPNR